MGMSDQQFEVYNALLTFVDELIDREQDEKEREKLKRKLKLGIFNPLLIAIFLVMGVLVLTGIVILFVKMMNGRH